MKNFSLAIVVAILFSIKVAAQYQNQPLVTETHEQSETHIEVNPLDAAHRIGGWNDFRNGVKDVGFAITTNHGVSWTIDLLENRTGWPGTPSVDQSYDPVVTFNRSGVPYYCYILERPGLLGALRVAKTTDNGISWTHTQINPNSIWDDKPWIAINNYPSMSERIYVVWAEILEDVTTRTYRILSAYSTDGGANFTMSSSNPLDQVIAPIGPIPPPAITAKPLSNFPWTQIEPHVLGAVCAVAPNGDVYAAWMLANADGSGAIKVRKSTNGGNTFGAVILNRSMTVTFPFTIGRIDIRNFPTMAIDSNTGKIYIAYTHKETSGDLNVYYTCSTNGGTTWSASAVATETTIGHQFFPALAVDQTGKIMLSYYDYRNQPNVDIYLAESLNNGTSFMAPNIKVTSGYATNNPTNSSYLHHYMGLTSTLGMSYPLWTDYRNANADVFYANVNRAPTSNAVTATAGNGQRKLVRESNGNYHLVFETNQEIWYTRKTTTDVEWNNYRRLNNGAGGNYASPSIAERGSNIYVAWQRLNGSSHEVYFHRSTDGGATWSDGNRQTRATGVGSNPPLPVLASPATNEVMLVYRTSGNLAWQRSTDNGSSWPTTGTITGTALNSPSVAPGKTPWGAAAPILAYATNVIPNASNVLIHYYNNGWSASYNLSSGLPGNLTQHANPSIAGSGDLTSSLPHTAWDAYDSQYSGRVILHKVGWGASSYYEFHYQEEDRPSITGLAGTTAEMIFRRGSDYFFTGHYNGSFWNIPLSPQSGKYPSFSLGNTQAKYVITSGSAAPYEVKLSSSTFSKAAVLAANNGTGSGNATAYHRAVGLANTTTGGWLNVRVESFLIKHADGSFSAADFSAAPADTAVLSSTTAWAALASTPFILPADAESLVVVLSVAGDKVTGISNSQNALTLQFKAQTAADQPVIKDFPAATFVSNQPFNQSNLRISMNTAGFSSGTLLRFAANLDNQKTGTAVVASLGHIYEYLDKPSSAPLKQLANQAPSLPTDFVLEQNFPNPFSANGTFGNPETQVRYSILQPAEVTLRIYTISGQVVATLFEGEQAAGTYTTKWNGLNSAGVRVSSGIYFYKLETKNFTQVRKLLLAK